MFIAEGRTDVVEGNQVGDVGDHWRDHSINGWQTQETFIHYLQHLRAEISGTEQIYLLLDQFKAHLTQAVRDKARDLHIELIEIPANCTGELQPLDRKVFGPLKAMAKHEYRRGAWHGADRGKRQACRDMVKVWDDLGENVIKSAWAHIIPEYEAEFGGTEEEENADAEDGGW
jgi:hypothetical protein